jgi:hypothetical protein
MLANWGRKRIVLPILIATLTVIVFIGYWQWHKPRATRPIEIYRGVTYSCEALNGEECRGFIYLARVDLTVPGVGIYLTPLDSAAVSRGYQYRLVNVPSVVGQEGLAVAINGTFFTADSGLFYQTGDLADSVQTIVADGQVSHVDPNSYMLWFEPDLTPHIETGKPPSNSVLGRARWGIGGGAVPLFRGQVRPGAANHEIDHRTAVAIDSHRRLLWLAVFENASPLAVARILAQHGAEDGFLLDGGHSSVMVLGSKATGVKPGTAFVGSRPVATVLGIRADPI